MPTLIASIVAAATAVSALSYNGASPVRQVIANLKAVSPGDSFIHLGSDGVLRVFTPDFQVSDMAPLDPIQIAELIQILPATEGTPDFTGVDGRNAPESTLRQPSDRIVAEAAEMVQKTSAQLESPNVNTLQARQRGCWDVLYGYSERFSEQFN
ncbi:hypothetical protein SAPIO_CDS2391 [Scedosporium apiospermum]|uniref:Uncharacterized protein n=1 Tax=Pseudallescheria apiosperma TaxID=563466 RepID=A0A084GCD9_PSEDA|nr:uncharacterized protein SAPIO_CDS2391 [Scedosporium apiospermum]KEZ45001.1 hypothetical protein SAPIO_CDS2391 [Scedosporium apiospermum]